MSQPDIRGSPMSADAVPNAAEQIPDHAHPAGVGLIKPGYDPQLTNEDLAPLHKQNWSTYKIFANLVAKPSQKTGVPYPVINRAIFGVKGANIPAIIRGLIAVAWYGVQTYLAAES